jgi:hypothetical protein
MPGLAQGVAHQRLGHTRQRRDVADGEAAIPAPADLGRHDGEHRDLSGREPGRELRGEPARGRPAASAL